MTARADYREITCKSAMNKVAGMPFDWSLNPYRGCVHGCHYCFARRYHEYFDLSVSDDFTGIVFVKTNVARVLREGLWLPKWRRETIAIGTATDPYQPIEGRYRLIRACLEEIAERGNPVSLVTKGPMAIRDIDVLSSIAAVADCSVCFSVTTLDADLAARLEPTTAPPRQRLRALELLAKAGIETGVLIAPVVPGITDEPERIDEVVRAASAHGATFVGGRVLELKAGTKAHFDGFLRAEFPSLTAKYAREYPGAHGPKETAERVQRWIAESAAAWGAQGRKRLVRKHAPRQLAMAIP